MSVILCFPPALDRVEPCIPVLSEVAREVTARGQSIETRAVSAGCLSWINGMFRPISYTVRLSSQGIIVRIQFQTAICSEFLTLLSHSAP